MTFFKDAKNGESVSFLDGIGTFPSSELFTRTGANEVTAKDNTKHFAHPDQRVYIIRTEPAPVADAQYRGQSSLWNIVAKIPASRVEIYEPCRTCGTEPVDLCGFCAKHCHC